VKMIEEEDEAVEEEEELLHEVVVIPVHGLRVEVEVVMLLLAVVQLKRQAQNSSSQGFLYPHSSSPAFGSDHYSFF
jgi:hypothetical protein